MFEFAFLAPLFGKFAKPAGYVLTALLAIAIFFGAKALYDHKIISNHDAKIDASAAKADRAADQNAAATETTNVARQNYEADQLTRAADDAPKNNPGVDPATARRIAFHKCLGLQQRARANGLQPPRCV